MAAGTDPRPTARTDPGPADPFGTDRHRLGRRGRRGWLRRPPGSGPLRRSREDRLAGGVAGGLAARTGLDATVVRTGFVVATVFGLIGAAAYVMAWLLIPAAGADANIAAKALTDRRGIALVAGLASLLVVVLVIASALRASWVGSLAWPLVISVAGLTLIWRNAPPDEQAVLQRLADPLLGLAEGRQRQPTPRCGAGGGRRRGAGVRAELAADRASGHGRTTRARRRDPRGGGDRHPAGSVVGAHRARPHGGAAGPDPGRRSAPSWPPTYTTRCCRR